MTLSPHKLQYNIRPILGRDQEGVLRIDRACYRPPLSAEELAEIVADRACFAMVADLGHETIGYILYHLHKEKYILARIAVQPEFTGLGVGKALVKHLVDKLSLTGRKRLETVVSERSLRGQLFLRSCGLSAIAVLRDYIEDDHDAYLFEYSLE